MIEAVVPPLYRWLLYTGVLWLVGAVAWHSWIRPSLEAEAVEGPAQWIARSAGWVAVALIPVWGMGLWAQVIGFRDPFAPLSEDIAFLLQETFWGTVWMGQGAVILLLAGSYFVAGFSRRGSARGMGWRAAAGGVVGLALSLALTSHAMSVAYNRPLAVAMDSAHTLAAGAWMGTLALILLVPSKGDGTLLPAQLRAFSPLAMAGVGVLLFMGVVLSAVHVGEWRNLWATEYGRMLLAKVGAAGVVLGLGFLNWRRGLPALDTAAGRRSTRIRASWEVGAALVVLLLTALLLGTPMPEGVHQ